MITRSPRQKCPDVREDPALECSNGTYLHHTMPHRVYTAPELYSKQLHGPYPGPASDNMDPNTRKPPEYILEIFSDPTYIKDMIKGL